MRATSPAGMRKFQSLIGRLQTICENHAHDIVVSGFQSLIGRLQTIRGAAGMPSPSRFQSLIGRLQTLSKYVPSEEQWKVSIPHR